LIGFRARSLSRAVPALPVVKRDGTSDQNCARKGASATVASHGDAWALVPTTGPKAVGRGLIVLTFRSIRGCTGGSSQAIRISVDARESCGLPRSWRRAWSGVWGEGCGDRVEVQCVCRCKPYWDLFRRVHGAGGGLLHTSRCPKQSAIRVSTRGAAVKSFAGLGD
jgi:hypothetical protein